MTKATQAFALRFRAIIRVDDAGMAANVGGAVQTEYITVPFESGALETALLGRHYGAGDQYHGVQIIGVEIEKEEVPF